MSNNPQYPFAAWQADMARRFRPSEDLGALAQSKPQAQSARCPVATGSDAFGATADSEIVEHMNKFLDELKWFREHSVKIHLSPTATGWNLKFSVPEK